MSNRKYQHNMKKILTAFICIVSFVTINSCSKRNSIVPPDTGGGNGNFDGTVVSDVVYGSNIDWMGQTQQLALDVYIPKSQSGVVQKYPLMMYVHGGGFHDGDKLNTVNYCTMMASLGYTVATINYRLGWSQDSIDRCNADTIQAAEAFYRAEQDARAAMRYLVAHASDYSIDTSWIFVGGASAGGLTTLGIAFYDQQTMDTYLPGLSTKLGPLDATNNIKIHYNIKAIAPEWGAVSTTDAITPQNAIPAILFHGGQDDVVPWNIGHYYACDNLNIGYGSKAVYDKLTALGVPAVAHIDPLGGHGVYTNSFRIPNIDCFFRSVMDGSAQKGYYTTQVSNCR